MYVNYDNTASRSVSDGSVSEGKDQLVREAARMLAESDNTEYTSQEITKRLNQGPLIFTPVGGQPASR